MEMFPYTWDSVEPSGGVFQTIVYDAHPSHKKLNISYKDQNITLFLLLGKHGYASDFSNENLQISTFLNFLKEKQSDRRWKQMKYFTHILYYWWSWGHRGHVRVVPMYAVAVMCELLDYSSSVVVYSIQHFYVVMLRRL